MKILSIRPAPPGSTTLARVDVEPSPGTRIYGVRVTRADDGTYRAFGPSNDRGRTCAFDHDVANQIAKLTVGALSQHECTSR
ncbi:hypothetical protein GGQ85_002639 [Nitrobacter vulgaris]|uniref:hypothetical protein n=1 Tax=Nitrobacter vulgaris TaxID=29421 RepID=UPI002855B173|nr:hypothetical protein [Nitrobacter vulgaris]MDR6304923.1 hypothetical protein [Nitrobacter vulgaris]